MKRRLTKAGKIIVGVAAALAIGGIGTAVWKNQPKKAAAAVATVSAAPSTAAPTPTATPSASPDSHYEERTAINPDYIGELSFESGLVDQNVVQSTDNEKYLNLSWDLQSTTQGAAFMDYRNSLTDQNLIIYGHYVYYDATKMFTPLEKLTDQANYEANQYIDLKLADETRKYQITDVFHYTMDDENLMYYYIAYDADYFQTYMNAVHAADFYSTGIDLTMSDHILTLQTCVRDHDEERLIVLARQIS
jgi:sortase B